MAPLAPIVGTSDWVFRTPCRSVAAQPHAQQRQQLNQHSQHHHNGDDHRRNEQDQLQGIARLVAADFAGLAVHQHRVILALEVVSAHPQRQ